MTAAPPARLRVAVVGLGWVALNRHLPALRRRPDVEVAGVVDRSAEKAAAVARRLGIRRSAGTAGSPDDVHWLEEVDAVTIATPPASHHPLAAAWLEAGRHVLVEKPFAMTRAEAGDLARRAAASRRVLAVVHNFQFARSLRRARRLLDGGRLGELRAVWATQLSNPRRRLPRWYEELPLGLFADESPHLFYLVRAFAGAGVTVGDARVTASTEGRRTPNSVSVGFENGSVPARLDMRFEAPVSEWQLALLGSEALAVVDLFRDILVVVPNDGAHAARDILSNSAHALAGHIWGTAASGARMVFGRLDYGNDEVVRRFVEATRTGEAPAGMGFEDGAAVVGLQHAVIDRA